MAKDRKGIPLDLFPEEVRSAILRIYRDTYLSNEKKEEEIHSIISQALIDPMTANQVRSALLSDPEFKRRVKPDPELKSQESYSTGGGFLELIFLLVALLRYPITWVILIILLIAYAASQVRC